MNNYSRKSFAFLLTLIAAPLIAGVYGILHDQFTYSVSNEYYTRFKFIQFGMWKGEGEAILENPRLAVSIVGFKATWWTGLFIGPVLALVGLIHKEAGAMLRANFKTILLTLYITLATGLVGLAYGWLALADKGVSWWLPEGLVDAKSFIMVGSMHNFSYLGGLFGMMAGIILHIFLKHKNETPATRFRLN